MNCQSGIPYPLPYMDAILNKLKEARYISTIDLKNGFWQVPLEPGSKERTAVTVPGRGLFQFTVMPFGLHNAPATFQRLLDNVLQENMLLLPGRCSRGKSDV
jgi:hypothetical protein